MNYIILFIMFLSPISIASVNEIVIRELANQDIVDGCGCYLSFVKNGKLVFANDYTDYAWVNINGVDTKVVQYKTNRGKEELKVGSKYIVYYSNDQYKIQIEYRVTSVCGKNDEECEYTGMDAILTVFTANKKASVKLTGGCGC